MTRMDTRPRLLIVGAGDVARRALPGLLPHYRVFVLCRRADQMERWRALGATPVAGDLDRPASLNRLGRLGCSVLLHTAPPAAEGHGDARSNRLIAALRKGGILPQRVVYISTSGVYGDRSGVLIDETARLAPESDRARRRVAAETLWRRYAIRAGASLTVLRAPGIYADDRLPLDRIRRATPTLHAADDGYTNHIHADDLARLCLAALRRRGGIRVYNACDDSSLKTGEWFDRLADWAGLPRVPRLSRIELQQAVSPALWSFLRESRRLSNARLKRELDVRLDYPSVDAFFAATPRQR